MSKEELIELNNKIKDLLSYCYEKNKTIMTDLEKKECEEYLYEQGEYELALDSLLMSLKSHAIELDKDCTVKIENVKKLMFREK